MNFDFLHYCVDCCSLLACAVSFVFMFVPMYCIRVFYTRCRCTQTAVRPLTDVCCRSSSTSFTLGFFSLVISALLLRSVRPDMTVLDWVSKLKYLPLLLSFPTQGFPLLHVEICCLFIICFPHFVLLDILLFFKSSKMLLFCFFSVSCFPNRLFYPRWDTADA